MCFTRPHVERAGMSLKRNTDETPNGMKVHIRKDGIEKQNVSWYKQIDKQYLIKPGIKW